MTVWTWSQNAAANANADPTINWNEGQAPSTVNNSARAMMAAVAKFRDDKGNANTTGGTSSAYTLVSQQTLTTLTDKFTISFVAHVANADAPTLAIDATAAKNIVATSGGANIGAGVMRAGSIYTATYDSATEKYILHNNPTEIDPFPVGAIVDFGGTTAPTGWLLCNGEQQNISAFPELNTVLGGAYNTTGDGITTFNVPDMRGRLGIGSDSMGAAAASRLTGATMSGDGTAPGETGGSETVTIAEAQLPAHTHSSGTLASTATNSQHQHDFTSDIQSQDHSHSTGNLPGEYTDAAQSGAGQVTPQSLEASYTTSSNNVDHTHDGTTDAADIKSEHGHDISGSTGSIGSGNPIDKMPPAIITYKIIKATSA